MGSLRWFHTLGDKVPGSHEVLPGLWVAQTVEELANLALHHQRDIRMCIGFAQWAGPQLTTELERGVWIHARHTGVSLANLCLSDGKPKASWKAALRKVRMPVLADFPRGDAIDAHLTSYLM